ncbi:hypothetical protein COO60DRAFT_811881 [Scenedesmus sp. NREL 46B-D3]|nr:hypothetical protein COO60DRAFT_811881 [Scenedesmus sp. NREL 46B-D3]
MLPPASLAGPVATVQYMDPAGAFRLQVPQGWQQVSLAPGTGILASWYDPANRGSDTLAVYASPTAAASTHDLGTAQEVGEALAGVSPGGTLQQWRSDRRTKGREYITRRYSSLVCLLGRLGRWWTSAALWSLRFWRDHGKEDRRSQLVG